MNVFHQISICSKHAKMKSLALGLVFCAFVSLSDSACSFTPPKAGAKLCVDDFDNSKHLMGSTWTNRRCVRCTCSPDGMKCCDTMGRPSVMTEGCIVKYSFKRCTFHVFHPKDPTVKCDYGVVGK